MPSACFDANRNLLTPWKHAEGMSLRYGAVIFGDLTHPQREDRNGGEMVEEKNPCFGWEAGICKLLERVVKYITVECPFIIPPYWVR